MLKYSNFKMVTAGDYVHLYEYKKAISYGYAKPKGLVKLKTQSKGSDSIKNNDYRTKKKVRFLLQANIPILTPLTRLQFVTYTFKKEVTDYKVANNILKKYHQRLNYDLKLKLSYLFVPEIQHSRAKKYGAKVWHFHVLYFNLPGVWYPRLYKIWGQGGIKVKQMNNLDHLINYVSKYFTKSDNDDYAKGQHKYNTSRGLSRPWEFREPDVITEFKKNLDGVGKPTYENTFITKSWDDSENETKYSLYKLTPEQKINFDKLKSVL
jgi:hypothetical protein